MKFLIIGSSNTDMVIKSNRIPFPGETILGGDFFMNPGGKGANQAVAAARLGGEVTFSGKVGNDIFGTQAINNLKSEGIDTRFLFTDQTTPSGVALITVNDEGENSIVVAPGANRRMSVPDIQQVLNEYHKYSYILLQLEIPLETIIEAAKLGKHHGIRVVLNPAPACSLPTEIFPLLYMITPNETEAQQLTGVEVVDEISALKACKILVDKGVEVVVITMGSKGAFYFHDNQYEMIAAPKVRAIDTTAAGDTFNGALVVALTEGEKLSGAISFACKAAALSVTKMGAQSSIPFLKDIDVYF